MQKIIIIFASLAVVVLAAPKPNHFDWNYGKSGTLGLNGLGTIYEDNGHKVEGVGSFARNFPSNTNAYGGGLKYSHEPSKLGAEVNVLDLGGGSRRVQADLTKTLLKDRFSNVEAGLSYGQTFTPFGNSEPFFGGIVKAKF